MGPTFESSHNTPKHTRSFVSFFQDPLNVSSLLLAIFSMAMLTISLLFPQQIFANSNWYAGVNAGVYGVRNYKVYVPMKAKNLKNPALVVLIHGCEQNPVEFAQGSRMIEESDRLGFVLLLPEQNKDYNPYKCWNWVLPFNQLRQGEPEVVRQMIEETISKFSIDREKIFVAGMSSGAALANILVNCYPEYFHGLASHDGVMYNATDNALDYEEVVVNGPSVAPWISGFRGLLCSGLNAKPKVMPAIIFHGMQGPIMSPVHAFQIENQLKVFNDYLDNNKRDYSFFKEKNVTYAPDHALYGHTLSTVTNKDGQVFIERYMINRLGHAWSGGDEKFPFNDPKGPPATQLIIKFFQRFGL